MRRSLAIRALIISTLIVVALAVPLAVAIRDLARERALTFGRADARALAPVVSLAGDPRVPGAIAEVARRALPREVSVVFPDGSVLGAIEVLDPDPIADSAAIDRARRGSAFLAESSFGVVVYEPVLRSNGTIVVIRVLVPVSQLGRGVVAWWLVLAVGGLALIGASVLVFDRLARSVVGSVRELSEVALGLGRGDLTIRAPLSGPEEVREVAGSMNVLADRVVELIGTERAAVADLSHRLRTPVTALRAETALLSARAGDPEASRGVEFAFEELNRTIDQIIRDAHRPVRSGIGVVCDAGEVVAERARFWAVLAEDQGRRMDVEVGVGPHPVPLVSGDLGAVIDILVDNVFSHTAEGTALRVTVAAALDEVEITVDDDGPGFQAPFDLQRGVSSGGSTGIGLDSARRMITAAGGVVIVRTRAPGGARVCVRLPRAA